MNKNLVTLGIIGGALALIVAWVISVNNNLVTLDEGMNEKWSQVQNVYQRRADLIPNLVNTVKGYAQHEDKVLNEVTQARAQVGQVKVGSADDLKNFEQSQGQLTSALSRLLVVSERYPDLKANKNFQELQSQLEGTENRIAVERMRFNEAAKDYNVAIRKFPTSLVAGFRNFKDRAYFSADAGAQTAPHVNF